MSSKYWKDWARKTIFRSTSFKPELKFHAQQYFDLGVPVVPLKIWFDKEKNKWQKTALTEWKKWQTERQTETEFVNLPWNEANGYGIVLGQKTKDGFYFAVLDYDTKNVSEEARKTGKEILGLLPETKVEKTVSGGLHYIYFSPEKLKNNTKFHDRCGLELFGERLIVSAPSEGYEVVDSRTPLTVEDLTFIFSKALQACGVQDEEKAKAKPKKHKKSKIRPCVASLLKNPSLSHEQRCVVAFEYLNAGFTLEKTIDLFRSQTDFSIDTTRKQLEHAIQTSYLPYSEEKLKELGICIGPSCPKYGEAFNIEVVYTPSVILEDGRIVEQGYDGKEVYFIVYDPETDKILKHPYVETESKVYMPIMNNDVATCQVMFPSEATEYGSDSDLSRDTRDFLNRWHEQLNIVQRQIDVYYPRLTNAADLLFQIPYRRALAKFGKGKTTFLETLGYICCRPFLTSGCSSEASIRRTFDLWRGTAIIDEADFKDVTLYATIIKILNIGYDRRTGYYRYCDENDPKKVLFSYVYGPKAIATRERYKDAALESRCLTFIGEEPKNRMPLFRGEQFLKEAQELRNKYVLWRFKNYYKFKQKLSVLEKIDAEEQIYGEEIKDVRSRVKQIVLPLLLIAEDRKDVEELVKFAKAFDADLKNLDEEARWEEQIERAIREIFKPEKKVEEKPQKRSAYGFSGYQIYLSDFAYALKIEDKEERTYWSRALSAYFKKRTSFPIRKGLGNRTCVFLPENYVEQITSKSPPELYDDNYVIHDNKHSEPIKLEKDWR